MKINTTDALDLSCELIQLSISDAIDSHENLSHEDAQHIESCTECAKFHELWHPDSAVTTIASGSLTEQQNLTQPIISQLEQDSKVTPLKEGNVIRGTFLKLASIAAVIAIASISAFTFFGPDEDKPSIAEVKPAENNLVINIPKIDLTLTEAEIEQSLERSLEKNYQNLSNSATETWKTATTRIGRATEYITNGTHYISNKYLPSLNEGTNGPQSQSTPQQDEPSHHRYG